MIRSRKRILTALTAGVLVALSGPAFAQLQLTAAGITDGFTLSTFATLDPGNGGCCNGPFGLAAAGGRVLVANGGNGTLYSFNDVDGQTPATALATQPSNSGVQAYASVGGVVYGSQNNQYVAFNLDGTVNHVLSTVGVGPSLGLSGAPNGHLIAASANGLVDIDPLANGGTGSSRLINGSVFADGVSVSPDGSLAVVETAGVIQTYNIATGAFVAQYNTSGAPDGTGVISGSALNGDIVANTNFGNIDLIDPTTGLFTTIATGGTRGDYTAPDTSNGTLLLDYSDIVARLAISGGSIGGPPPVPEPASLAILGLGVMALGLARRRS